MTKITEKEERIMFHTLGYDYQPRWNDGSFKDFLDWLKITEKDELYYPEMVKVIKDYKKRWQI